MLSAEFWVLSAECWVLSAECWVLSAECWVLSAECWVLSAECWVLSHESWVMSHESWVMSHESWVMSHESWRSLHSAPGFVTDVLLVPLSRSSRLRACLLYKSCKLKLMFLCRSCLTVPVFLSFCRNYLQTYVYTPCYQVLEYFTSHLWHTNRKCTWRYPDFTHQRRFWLFSSRRYFNEGQGERHRKPQVMRTILP